MDRIGYRIAMENLAGVRRDSKRRLIESNCKKEQMRKYTLQQTVIRECVGRTARLSYSRMIRDDVRLASFSPTGAETKASNIRITNFYAKNNKKQWNEKVNRDERKTRESARHLLPVQNTHTHTHTRVLQWRREAAQNTSGQDKTNPFLLHCDCVCN